IMQWVSLACIYPAFGQPVFFDFDSAPLHSSLPINQTVNGVTAHFTATGSGYSIQQADVLGFTPLGFSGRIIYPNSIFLADLLIKFDATLTDFSTMYSCQELGCDDAATMRVNAYMNGVFVGTHTHTAINPGTWPVDTIRFTLAQGFDSVVLHYDSRPPTCQDYGVIFMADNMQVTPVGALPVTLIYFDCEVRQNAVFLQWKSGEEINLSNYIVQYSNDGGNFEDVARINAVGSHHVYSFIHPGKNGIAYYRLKISDLDGSFKYSETRKLAFDTQPGFTIVPNPARDHIQICFDNSLYLRKVQIFSIDGILLKTVINYTAGQTIPLKDLPPGIYILKRSSSNESPFEKLFLKM
ncbi:MAG TPA: T9SS type A sorting domain-containing protein, partial [Chitinophagaceae bacterium]|nr:T9SS type A sorting domain-containing protein [Chitinophagaceae bacterium]